MSLGLLAASRSRYWQSDDSSFGEGPKPYWYSNRPKAIEVETTSYALLALLQRDIKYTHAIVNWLTNQENYEGGFVSTQVGPHQFNFVSMCGMFFVLIHF